MSLLALLGLVGLALVDSTSIGTLVLPLLMLLSPRVHVGRYLVYLGTVALLYAAVGIALVAGAGALMDLASGLGEVRAVRWAELALGAGLLAVGVFGDPRGWAGGRRTADRERAAVTTGSGGRSVAAGESGGTAPVGRRASWRERLLGPEASYAAVAAVGLVAALVELGSMLPFLAAVGIITAAGLPTAAWVGVVLGYVLVMVLPALLLLALRLALGDRLARRLERLAAWLDKSSGGAAYWAMAIIGLVLLQDARVALGLG